MTKTLWFNSALTFALAGMLAITLHELAHLVAGKLLGEPAVLYSNAVDFPDSPTQAHQITTALAGPLFSLVLGVGLLVIAKNWGKNFGRLFWMWLGLLSTQIFAGYCIIAPFAQNGDTGKALKLLEAPGMVFAISFVIGVALMLWLARQFAKQILRYTDVTIKTMRPFGIYSWLLGTGLLMLLYIFAVRNLSDDDQVVTLAGVATVGIFAPVFSFFWRKLPRPQPEILELRTPVAGLVGLVAAAIVIVGLLGGGISFL